MKHVTYSPSWKEKIDGVQQKLKDQRDESMGAALSDEERQLLSLHYRQALRDYRLLDSVSVSLKNIIEADDSTGKESLWHKLCYSTYGTLGLTIVNFALYLLDFSRFFSIVVFILTLVQMVFILLKNDKKAPPHWDVELCLQNDILDAMASKQRNDLQLATAEIKRLTTAPISATPTISHIETLYCELCAMEAMDDITQISYCKQLAKHLLRANDREPVSYSDSTKELYTVYASDMQSITVRPAIRRISDHSLCVKGEHYVKNTGEMS